MTDQAQDPKEPKSASSAEEADTSGKEEVKEEKPKKEHKQKVPKKDDTPKTPGFPDVKPGMTVKVHQRIKDVDAKGKEKERTQIFEGMVLARKGGMENGATITVRKVSKGIGVEKIFPLHSPVIAKIEIIKKARVRRAKLYYLRTFKKRLKEKKV